MRESTTDLTAALGLPDELGIAVDEAASLHVAIAGLDWRMGAGWIRFRLEQVTLRMLMCLVEAGGWVNQSRRKRRLHDLETSARKCVVLLRVARLRALAPEDDVDQVLIAALEFIARRSSWHEATPTESTHTPEDVTPVDDESSATASVSTETVDRPPTSTPDRAHSDEMEHESSTQPGGAHHEKAQPVARHTSPPGEPAATAPG
jgi:hypothetical protein